MSPLERLALRTLLSLIRDREPDRDEWTCTDVKLAELYDATFACAPDKSWELSRRNHRQAMRRALGRLHPDYVTAIALAWVNVDDESIIQWQGGGSRTSDGIDTPRWRLIALTDAGVRLAELIAGEVAA